MKNIATGGIAATIEPALIMLYCATNWLLKLVIPAVTGCASGPWVNTIAQK